MVRVLRGDAEGRELVPGERTLGWKPGTVLGNVEKIIPVGLKPPAVLASGSLLCENTYYTYVYPF